jgi:hypothetical protein
MMVRLKTIFPCLSNIRGGSVELVQEPFCQMQPAGSNGKDMVTCTTRWPEKLARPAGL